MENQDYLIREEKNKKLYDELTEKYNLYNESQVQAVWLVRDEIQKIRQYLLAGIEGKNSPVLTEQGVYIQSTDVDDFNASIKKLAEMEAQIKTDLPDHIQRLEEKRKESGKLEFNLDEEVRKLEAVPIKDEDNFHEFRSQSAVFYDAMLRSTYDDRKKIETKLREVTNSWYKSQQYRLDQVKEQRQQEINNHKEAYKAAKDRYRNLSLWGKLIAKMQKKDVKHLDEFTTEELNGLYSGKKTM